MWFFTCFFILKLIPASTYTTPVFFLIHDFQVCIYFLLHLFNVGDYSDNAVFLAERFEGVKNNVQGLFVQRTEAFVEEKEILTGFGDFLNVVGQSECK